MTIDHVRVVAVPAEVALGLLAAYLVVRPRLKGWPLFVAARWPAYAEAVARLPKRSRRQLRRAIRRGESVADVPDLLGLASIEVTARVFRAVAIRRRPRPGPSLLLQYALLPAVVCVGFVTGDRATRLACVAAVALVVSLVLYYVRLRLRNRLTPGRVARARAATVADLHRSGRSPADVRPLLDGPPGKVARAKSAEAAWRPPRRRLGGWAPIAAFVAAAFGIGIWGDVGTGTTLPDDLRLPRSSPRRRIRSTPFSST